LGGKENNEEGKKLIIKNNRAKSVLIIEIDNPEGVQGDIKTGSLFLLAATSVVLISAYKVLATCTDNIIFVLFPSLSFFVRIRFAKT